MRKVLGMMAVAALLAACADEDSTDTGDTVDLGDDANAAPGDAPVVTSNSAAVGDVDSITYNGSDVLTVTIPLDADTATTSYTPSGSVGTYNRFTQQDDPLDRAYTAFAKTSNDGSVTAATISDGGQFNRFFGGARVVQNNYTAPSGGLVSYGGDYVGVVNFGPVVGGNPSAPDSAQPSGAGEVAGNVFLNADFNFGQVNGVIYDRELVVGTIPGTGGRTALEDIVLVPTDVTPTGTFSGGGEFNDNDLTGVGSYAGVFGGQNGATIGGVVNLTAGFLNTIEPDGTLSDDDPGNGNENEYGIFVLDICPGGGTPATCFDAEGPNDP